MGSQTISAFLDTWICHLDFEISCPVRTQSQVHLLNPLVTVLVCACACVRLCARVCTRACVRVSQMVTFNCFRDHRVVGHRSFVIGTRGFRNCQMNWLWPVFCKDSEGCDFGLTPQGTILNGKKKNVPLGDIPCKMCVILMNLNAHILNNCYFWTSDVLCCHLNLREAV